MKLLLIYNPASGFGRAKKKLLQVESLFKQNAMDYDLHLTCRSGHALEIAGMAKFEAYDGLVAAGGDGTLLEVINGYFQNASRKRIPLGVLPVGTGNAFARELELGAWSWEKAIDIIRGNKTKKVDVGRFRTQSQDFYRRAYKFGRDRNVPGKTHQYHHRYSTIPDS